MTASTRRSKVVLRVLMVVTLIGVAFCWETGWDWLNTDRVDFRIVVESGPTVRGWKTVKRWGSRAGVKHGTETLWWQDTGLLHSKTIYDDGTLLGRTFWNRDGTVRVQVRAYDRAPRPKTSPPWWWNVTDQTEPTAPWWTGKKDPTASRSGAGTTP